MKEDILFKVAMMISGSIHKDPKLYELYTDLAWEIVEEVNLYNVGQITDLFKERKTNGKVEHPRTP